MNSKTSSATPRYITGLAVDQNAYACLQVRLDVGPKKCGFQPNLNIAGSAVSNRWQMVAALMYGQPARMVNFRWTRPRTLQALQ